MNQLRSFHPSDPRNFLTARVGNPPAKVSAARRQVSENEGAWPTELYDHLVVEHDWVRRLDVHPVIDRASDGAGVGYFLLKPRQASQTALAAGEVGSVSIPFVIRDNRVTPFMVFAHKNAFYPITEERVMRVLRLKNAVMEVDRQDFRALEPSRYFPPSMRSNGLSLRGTEFASKFASIADHSLARRMAKTSSVSDPLAGIDLSVAAMALAREFRKTSSGYEYRTYWASHPQTGDARLDPWTAISLREVVNRAGAEGLKELETKLSHVQGLNPESLQLLPPPSPAPTQKAAVKVSFDEETRKGSVPGSLYLGTKYMGVYFPVFNNWGTLPDVCYYVCLQAAPGTSGEAVDRLNKEGLTFVADPSLPVPEEAYAQALSRFQKIPVYDSYSGTPPKALPIFVNKEPQAGRRLWVEMPRDEGLVFDLNGLTTFALKQTQFLSIDPRISSILVDQGADRTITYVAPHLVCVPGSAAGDVPLPAMTPPPFPGTPEAPAQEVPPQAPADMVRVSCAEGRLFDVQSENFLPGLPVRTLLEPAAKVLLAAHGFSTKESQALVDLARAQGTAEVWVSRATYPLLNLGRDAAESVKADYVAKLAEVNLSELARVRSTLHLFETAAARLLSEKEDLRKESATALGDSVDTILGLGALVPENLWRYCGMLENLETSLSQLCALLVACWLGLDEIDEDNTISAIRALDTVITGLKVIETSLMSTRA